LKKNLGANSNYYISFKTKYNNSRRTERFRDKKKNSDTLDDEEQNHEEQNDEEQNDEEQNDEEQNDEERNDEERKEDEEIVQT
jgi:hypothetical protein